MDDVQKEKEKELAAKEAVKFVKDGQVVGLGSGSTAYYAIREIGVRVGEGLRIQGVPTSVKTQELATSMHIPMIDIHKIDTIDITIDGADEFEDDLSLIKGGGGALLREKVVASMTKEQIIIADSSKKVNKLGRFKVPVEVIPFASAYVLSQLKRMGGTGTIRQKDGKPYLTDQNNYIIDTDFGLIDNPVILAGRLKNVVGLVEHGLFIKLVSRVIMGTDDRTVTFSTKS
jgi:ribose 5-phosphate isomerase A